MLAVIIKNVSVKFKLFNKTLLFKMFLFMLIQASVAATVLLNFRSTLVNEQILMEPRLHSDARYLRDSILHSFDAIEISIANSLKNSTKNSEETSLDDAVLFKNLGDSLDSLKIIAPIMEAYTLIDSEGTIYEGHPKLNVEEAIRNTGYFNNLREGSLKMYSSPYQDTLTGQWKYSIYFRINDQRKNFKGIIVVNIDLKYLNNFCKYSNMTDNIGRYIVDASNKIIMPCGYFNFKTMRTSYDLLLANLGDKDSKVNIENSNRYENSNSVSFFTSIPNVFGLKIVTILKKESYYYYLSALILQSYISIMTILIADFLIILMYFNALLQSIERREIKRNRV